MGSFGIPVSIFVIPVMVTYWRIGVLVMTLLAKLQLLACAFHLVRPPKSIISHHCAVLCSGFAAPQPLVIFECLDRVVAPFFTTLTGASIVVPIRLDYKLNHPQTHQFLRYSSTLSQLISQLLENSS